MKRCLRSCAIAACMLSVAGLGVRGQGSTGAAKGSGVASWVPAVTGIEGGFTPHIVAHPASRSPLLPAADANWHALLATKFLRDIKESRDVLQSQLVAQFSNASKVLTTVSLAAVQVQPPVTDAAAAHPVGGDEPNFYVRVSAEFVALAGKKEGQELQQDIAKRQNRPLQDCILGTNISGTTSLKDMNRAVAALEPSNDGAVLLIKHDGRVESNTVGVHPPVTIYSHGTTTYSAYSRIMFDADGFHPFGCASASACTSTCIDGLCICGGRLVQRIATKRVYRSKPEAECIAGQHAAARVSEQINAETPDQLGKTAAQFREAPAQVDDPEESEKPNQVLYKKIIRPLENSKAYPALRMSSTPEWLWIVGREINGPHTEAPTPAPLAALNPAILAVQVHESFINNMAEKTLGGQTKSDKDFADMFQDLFNANLEETLQQAEKEAGKKPTADQKQEDKQPELRKVTFTKTRPVIVAFGDQGFDITLRAARYSRPDFNMPDLPGMEVTAHYKIVSRTDGTPDHAERTKFTVEISPEAAVMEKELGHLRFISAKGAAHGAAERYFQRRLPERINFKGLLFTKGSLAKVTPTDDSRLPATQLQASQGWLTLGWSLPQAKK